ncbi:MAG: electron transfer flavoprotein subunit beta [SAR324 cluster bacterium]|uniref:Electron transfer flavoprotein subunit beta n=1 Tax=SAR324 cluster bacterium TaxID=2024889 RepID=A0A2A4SRB0_9DELT|nr:MAG: electron transfer flavoprotein subunit beta [SAR324 cluster bacterium]
MNILVTVKNVVDVELNIQVKNGAIVQDGLQYVMNAWDENAVEATVVLKEDQGASTELVCIGDGTATVAIRKAFAMGIEGGLLIEDEAIKNVDSASYAKILQKVYEQGDYDLVITGKQSQDTDSGQTGILLAEFLGLPCVSNVVTIEAIDDKNLKVTRQADGNKEVIALQLPAVITVNDSINEPRLPALRGIMQAKKKKIKNLDLSDLGLSADDMAASKTKVLEYQAPQSRGAGQKFEGDAAEITSQVVNLLATEAKVF